MGKATLLIEPVTAEEQNILKRRSRTGAAIFDSLASRTTPSSRCSQILDISRIIVWRIANITDVRPRTAPLSRGPRRAELVSPRADFTPLRLGVSVTLGNVTMSHRTREPAECLASLSHSTMIGLPRAALRIVHSCKCIATPPRGPADAPRMRRAGALALAIYSLVIISRPRFFIYERGIEISFVIIVYSLSLTAAYFVYRNIKLEKSSNKMINNELQERKCNVKDDEEKKFQPKMKS
ncbi:hypothetical protein EVAR_41880_1 [Eumeta japonica]|uniref:Uncharacterized protein n=1 Tax=Eumeta variegata TaxID=151549 RepID=A0A4C1X8P7_EUMVA|nr:hypothetical protein EVAR_41880_1 [Eumeta japonica]